MSSSGSHLSKDMLELIKSIGDSRSKQEEDKIILRELDTLKVKIKESNINAKKMKEYLMRAIYIEMLGHEAAFSHFQAVNLTQDKNLMNKRVGYLASNILLNENSECLIMLVSTLQKDITSLHWIEVCMALSTIIKFANSSIIVQAVIEQVYKLLDNKSEQIRKKAVCCLHRFYQVSPTKVPDINDKMRKMLCDYDPSVMASSLNFFHEVVMKDSSEYKDLVSSFVVILKQVIEHKLPRDYDYHRLPAPWIQMKILQILAYLGKDDQSASEGMYEMLSQVLRRADDTGINIGYAIVYQCLRTICIIYPNPHLLEQASTTISRFLSSVSPNLRCTGINGLSLIIQINQDYVANHQQVIVDCLEENDETLKKNTFELLYKMTDTNNVEVIVDKMIAYLKTTEVEGAGRKNILFKITELAELYAPDKRWFIKIMNQLFVNFGNLITEDILSKLIKIINEWAEETDEEEFKEFTILNYTEIVNTVSNLGDHLVQLIAYIFGEYSILLANGNEEEIDSNLKLLEYLLEKQYDHNKTKSMILTAFTKIHLNLDFKGYEFITNIMEYFSNYKDVDIQQKAKEYLRMKNKNLLKSKDILNNGVTRELVVDSSLSFLDAFVRKRIEEGCAVYNRSTFERRFNKKDEKTLNLNAYPESMINKHNVKNIEGISKSEIGVSINKSTNENKNLWTTKGFNSELANPKVNKETPTNTESNIFKPKITSVGNTISKKGEVTTVISSKNSDPRYATIKGGGKVGKSSFPIEKSEITKKSTPTPEIKFDPKKAEKEELKNKLFSKGGTTSTTTTSKILFDKSKLGTSGTIGKFGVSNKTNKQEEKAEKVNNLIDIGGPESNNKKETNIKPTTSNELMDIFGLGSTPSSEITTNNQNPTIPKSNITTSLDDIFGGISTDTTVNNTTINNNVEQSKSNFNTDIFDMFGNSAQKTNQSHQQKSLFKPYVIDTDTFGEMWVDCPNDEIEAQLSNSKITSPEQYFSLIKGEGIHPIEIINEEAISSCYFNDRIVLLHATITNSSVSVLIKSNDTNTMNEVKNQLDSLLIR